jgi:G:T/U-mismatch repair DNA glycosylase
VALRIRRTKGNCSDSNLEIIEYNNDDIKLCLDKAITQIFFTSKFVEKHFKKQFPNINTPTTVLLSPSPAANTYIATIPEYKELIESKEISGTFEYRLRKYCEALGL